MEDTPDLAVVLVDCDGDPDRRQRLLESVAPCRVKKVVAVAVEEFEAWLVADAQAVANALDGMPADAPASAERLPPREAKSRLARWIGESSRNAVGGAQLRREIAERVNLGHLARTCPAFDQFRKDLAEVAGA